MPVKVSSYHGHLRRAKVCDSANSPRAVRDRSLCHLSVGLSSIISQYAISHWPPSTQCCLLEPGYSSVAVQKCGCTAGTEAVVWPSRPCATAEAGSSFVLDPRRLFQPRKDCSPCNICIDPLRRSRFCAIDGALRVASGWPRTLMQDLA
jgi:hypothetical protein